MQFKKLRVLKALMLVSALQLSGCSTGTYLHPESTEGVLRSSSRTCPGASEARQYWIKKAQPPVSWVTLVVYASLPGTGEWSKVSRSVVRTEDTQLRVEFWSYAKSPSAYFAVSKEAKETAQKIYDEERRISEVPILVTASSPYITLILSSGERKSVFVPYLQTAFDPMNRDMEFAPIHLWSGRLDDFSIIFPDVFVNGEKFEISPVHYKIKEDTYIPVFNC